LLKTGYRRPPTIYECIVQIVIIGNSTSPDPFHLGPAFPCSSHVGFYPGPGWVAHFLIGKLSDSYQLNFGISHAEHPAKERCGRGMPLRTHESSQSSFVFSVRRCERDSSYRFTMTPSLWGGPLPVASLLTTKILRIKLFRRAGTLLPM